MNQQKPPSLPVHHRLLGGAIVLGALVAIGLFSARVMSMAWASVPFLSIAEINALGRQPNWWERLVIEDGYPLVILYMLLTVPTWVASILARSSEWYLGGILGAILGVGMGYVLSSVPIAMLGAVVLGIVGALFDHHVSIHYNHRIQSNQHPSWWAGGRHGVFVWRHITQ